MRIESEPAFRYPDSTDPNKQTKNHKDILSLNSVHQIIINFTESNISTTNDEEYRPIVIFYDGPERYSTKNNIRDSLPIIVNFAVPVRAIIYAPNSPVVVIGEAADQFQGFIVAKKYMRLKTTEDFEAEIDLYDKTNDKGINEKTGDIIPGDNYRKKVAEDNPYYGVMHGTVYRDNGEPKMINWLYKKITNSDGGFDMYVDDYGNVQYVELASPPTGCGTYDTLGKTEFASHSYKIMGSSADNMLLSGVKFDYETNSNDDGDIRYKGTL